MMKNPPAVVAGLIFSLSVLSLYQLNPGLVTWSWPVFGAAIVVGFYVILPLRIHRDKWMGCAPDFREIDPEEPHQPDAVLYEVRRTASGLGPLGFIRKGCYEMEGLQSGTFRIFFSIWENPRTLEKARLVIMVSARNAFPTLAIQTEYRDGTLFTTAHTKSPFVIPAARVRPGSLAFPQVSDPRRLCEIHRARADPDGRSDLGIDDPIAYMRWSMAQEHAFLIARGYYRLDPSGTRLRPTWKGACLMTWRLLWPWKPILLAARRRKAARVLRDLNLD